MKESLAPQDEPLWKCILQQHAKERIPQAMVFISTDQARMRDFLQRCMALVLCERPDKAPCAHCRSCHLLKQGAHPDAHFVRPESVTSAIKIEQIRALHDTVYQSTQRRGRCVIVIDPAEKMNHAAGNALLKMLEEPPAQTLFILITQQIGRLLPTIISRCQRYVFPVSMQDGIFNTEQRTEIMQGLAELLNEKLTVCELASQWSTYELQALLHLLYALFAESLRYHLVGPSYCAEESSFWQLMIKKVNPLSLFKLLDGLQAALKALQRNIHLNSQLVMEDLLLNLKGVARISLA